jgi:hypothetical protein
MVWPVHNHEFSAGYRVIGRIMDSLGTVFNANMVTFGYTSATLPPFFFSTDVSVKVMAILHLCSMHAVPLEKGWMLLVVDDLVASYDEISTPGTPFHSSLPREEAEAFRESTVRLLDLQVPDGHWIVLPEQVVARCEE